MKNPVNFLLSILSTDEHHRNGGSCQDLTARFSSGSPPTSHARRPELVVLLFKSRQTTLAHFSSVFFASPHGLSDDAQKFARRGFRPHLGNIFRPERPSLHASTIDRHDRNAPICLVSTGATDERERKGEKRKESQEKSKSV